MSESSNTQDRHVAQRAFAEEFNAASHQFKEDPDEERSPKYLLLPTGQRANRVFVVGTLTEREDLGDDTEYWRGRVVDPTGTFFVYAGQYQPDAASVLRELEPPAYVAVVGKPRTYEPDSDDADGGDESPDVYVSITPEEIAVVDGETRDQWVVETANRTIGRIEAFDDEANGDAQMAREHYDVALDEYQEMVVEALKSLNEDDEAAAEDTEAGAEDGGEQASGPA